MKKSFSYIRATKNGFTLELPLIKRTFESLYINYNNSSSSFWNMFEDMYVDDYIFGLTMINNNELFFYSLNLDKFEEEEMLITNFEMKTINVAWIKYSIIILHYNNQFKVISNIGNKDFSIGITNDLIVVKNSVLNSVVFEHKVTDKKYCLDVFDYWIEKNNTDKDVLDNSSWKRINATDYNFLEIYYFSNLFLKWTNYNFLTIYKEKYYNLSKKNTEDFYPESILSIYKKLNIQEQKLLYTPNFFDGILWKHIQFDSKILSDIKRYLLFKNHHNIVLDYDEKYSDIDDEFNWFVNIGAWIEKEFLQWFWSKEINIKFDNIEKIPKDLGLFNRQLLFFQMNLYNLDKNSVKISEIKNEVDSTKLKEQKLRLAITEKNINKLRGEYVDLLKRYLEKIY